MSTEDEFLKNLFIESNREVKEGYVRLESKIEKLWTSMDDRVAAIEHKQSEHNDKINQHDHTFKLGGVLFSACTVLAGLVIAVWNSIPHK